MTYDISRRRTVLVLFVFANLAVVIASPHAYAIVITSLAPDPGSSSYDVVSGDLHVARLFTDVPYVRVDWYVDGVPQSSTYGDGSSTTAYFSRSYAGSTTGQTHEIRAFAYGQGSAWD